MSYGKRMFYVVTRALGEAMQNGSRQQPKGTVYAIKETKEDAETFLKGMTVFLPETSKRVACRVVPAIIVEL